MKLNQYIAVLPLLLLLSGCKVEGPKDTLSNNGEKTPLRVSALLDAGVGEVTRAANMDFASGDQLIAYLRHVTWNGGFTSEEADKRTVVTADQAPRLVTFTCTGSTAWDNSMADIFPFGSETIAITGQGEHPDTKQATGLTASYTNTAGETTNGLYWDDFSAGAKGDATDIRTAGHYLQSYYGYCYNGGTPVEGLDYDDNTEKGVIKWAVKTTQNDGAAKTNFQHSDLLWSAEQTPVPYAHVDGEGNRNHGTLILPYTHAMSKVTIKVTLHESFGEGADFSSVTTTLHEMFTHCTCTAPTYTLSEKGSSAGVDKVADVAMWNGSTPAEVTKTCTFEAIVVPSILSVVNNFATITGLDGNTYVIPTTEAMLTGWGTQLTETDEHINNGIAQVGPRKTGSVTINRGKGYEMKSGVNYVLNVNISKQEITVSALIKDWVNVEAEGTALVQFDSDVNGKGEIDEHLRTHGFDVYKSSTNSDFDTKTTTLTWDNTNSKWIYTPIIYWDGQEDLSYFRALSPKDATTAMAQGTDKLWGTSGNTAVTPRTGDVPLNFEHAMAKISISLDGGTGVESVDVTGAKISIINIYDGGTLDLATGNTSALTASSNMPIENYLAAGATGEHVLSHLPIISQSLTVDKDGNPRAGTATFYSLNDLTNIYSDGTSIDNGSVPTTYVTATLTPVCYTETEKNAYNALLPGAVTTSDVRVPATYYTDETATVYNATLDGAVKAGDIETPAVPAVLYANVSEYNTAKGTSLTEQEFAALSDAEKTKTPGVPAVLYTEETAKAHNAALPGAVKAGDQATPTEYYTQEEANAYNATLEGAVLTTTPKSYLKNESSVAAKVGDIKSAGTMVMLHILLANNTSYTLDLAKCLDDSHHYVDTWEHGKHYSYTISLRKERITFLANIKDWVEATGSGNATLDWD